jgi:hypothetical protein
MMLAATALALALMAGMHHSSAVLCARLASKLRKRRHIAVLLTLNSSSFLTGANAEVHKINLYKQKPVAAEYLENGTPAHLWAPKPQSSHHLVYTLTFRGQR